MIISHRYRYLFIEIPLTASWAIRNELCDHYDGTPILHKHASLPEFCKIASEKERGYFVFATVRNPLDEVVSRYFKLKRDYKQLFSRPDAVKENLSDYSDLERYRFVHENDASFADYFCKYHQRTFSGMIDLSYGGLDFVIHFERLQEDFAEALGEIGLEPMRPIPQSNKTPERDSRWQQYYTAELVPQAQRVFGPFMTRWGYNMPTSWGDYRHRRWDEMQYRLVCLLRYYYFIHFRYSNARAAQAVRILRAKLLD